MTTIILAPILLRLWLVSGSTRNFEIGSWLGNTPGDYGSLHRCSITD
ncbi:MAG: hypothetical protein R3C11_26860 [Planctomycetaceae bacterium]